MPNFFSLTHRSLSPLALSLLCALSFAACRARVDPRANRPQPSIPLSPSLSISSLDGYGRATWNAPAWASSYNVYWSTTPGVTTSSNKITGATSPFNLGGLVNGQTYYMAVTAVGSLGESGLSQEGTIAPVNGAGAADTLFTSQWHLDNTGQSAGTVGEDINVDTAWAACAGAATCRGEGVRIAVIDDGMEPAHEDLLANVAPGLSYNYLTGTSNPDYPSSNTTSGHGQMCAGIAGARDLNGLGVRGVAPRSNLVAYNLLQSLTSANEADSMARNIASVAVSTNSWGAVDGTGSLSAASTTWKTAIQTGLTTGRGGLGTVYVWAAGNGDGGLASPLVIDNSNQDGQANHRGVMAIGSVLDTGAKAYYSERGANLWVSAPGGNSPCASTHLVTTTDRTGSSGRNTDGTADYTDLAYTKCMNGTSAATPMVAGVAALVIQAKPTLGWRDVRVILATTARKNDPLQIDWSTNAAGLNINPNYGFGVVDAQAAVTAAAAYGANLGTELTHTTATATPGLAIPDNDTTGVTSDIVVAASGITQIEFIEVTFTAAHTSMSDLEVSLTNTTTAGSAVSVLAETHDCPTAATCTAYTAWVFGDTMHLNEAANGTWRLTVKDKRAGTTGTFTSWGLKFYGT